MPVFDPDLSKKRGIASTHGALSKDAKQAETRWTNTLMEEYNMSKGEAKHMIHDLARLPVDGKTLRFEEIADKWDMAETQVREIHGRMKGDYGHFRKTTANMALMCASLLNTNIAERLMDPDELAKIDTFKMSKMAKELGDLAVILQDGHQPSVNVNMGDLMTGLKDVGKTLSEVKKITGRK